MPRAVLDLGDVYTGQTVRDHVIIENVGTDTLHITDIKPSCGCTAGLLRDDKRVLPPSDSVELTIVFDTKDQAGAVTKFVAITSNDPVQPTLNVQFSSYVIEQFKINPPRMFFYVTRLDSFYRTVVSVKYQGKDSVAQLISVSPEMANLRIRPTKATLHRGETIQLEAAYLPGDSLDSHGKIELITNQPLEQKIDIPVYCWWRGKRR